MKEIREESSIERDQHANLLAKLPSELELESADLENVAGGSPDLEPPGSK